MLNNNIVITESNSVGYKERTEYNAKVASDYTLAFAVDMFTAGEILTKKAAGLKYLGFDINKDNIKNELYINDWASRISREIKRKSIKTLNLAGNGIYTLSRSGIKQKDINLFMYKILKNINEQTGVKDFVNGGQTGVDMSCTIACSVLGFNCTVNMPKNYKMRYENSEDVNQTLDIVEKYIIDKTTELKSIIENTNNNESNNEIVEQTEVMKNKIKF